MKSSAILRAAKEEIVTCGWGQGNEMGDLCIQAGEPCCTMTALWRFQWDRDVHEVYRWLAPHVYLFRALTGYVKPYDPSIMIDWNDDPERTVDDVLALYDRAIEMAEEDGQ